MRVEHSKQAKHSGQPAIQRPVRAAASNRSFIWILLFGLAVAVPQAHGAKIGDLGDFSLIDQIIRFFSFKDTVVRYALIGSLLLGITSGLLGSFIVVRKMALLGDALSHAVLPGVALGWLWNMTRDPFAIFVGATIAGLVGTALVGWIKQTTRLKEDTALGMVLAGFYSIGICLVTMIQDLPTGNKGGIDDFLFGQAAAIGANDIKLMAIVTVLAVGLVALLYKEFLVTSFDIGFGQTTGLPVHLLHHLLMLLLAFGVVIALQAVGVVLVSAMLIIPASTAYMLTDRMHHMLWLAALFGMIAGVIGAFLSFLGPSLPTGPLMVLAASSIFSLAFLFGPRHGVAVRWWLHRSRTLKTQRENTLKALYHVLEKREFQEQSVSLQDLARQRREPVSTTRSQVNHLRRHGLVTWAEGLQILFTPQGWQQACSIVRNHRLWELYLTNAVNLAADHVHDDAEKIEHVLGEDAVRQLERRLNYATRDPHGREIPGMADIQGGVAPPEPNEITGYGKTP